jgi:Concanavalin A-like lectin/glucanases superfamily
MARHFTRASSQLLWSGSPWVTAMPFTFAGWHYPTVQISGELHALISMSSSGSRYGLIWAQDVSGRMSASTTIYTSTGQQGSPASPGTITLNTWNHVAGLVTTNTIAVYLHGANKAFTNGTFNDYIAGELVTAQLGAYYYDGGTLAHGMTGRLAEWGIWNVALTDDEIAALGKGVSPLLVRPSALVGYYPLFANDSHEPDRSRSGKNLALFGGPPKADHTRMFYPWRSTIAAQVQPAVTLQAAATTTVGANARLSFTSMPLVAASQFTTGATATLTAPGGFASVAGLRLATSGVLTTRATFAATPSFAFAAAGSFEEAPIAQFALYAQNANKTSGLLIHAE